ncbi:thiamine phosphate synthase [Mucilaginibacter sp. cycad4]|uniref:thiamine phosphate synthase n=1 Tax=Mucilaginibacter sp. cycad4 TaxID=3342096 RepID=UPI002AAC01DD|nr:thiamine phosphate synthase [Mucilaginibacter gossypii]WPV02038.1 thiamine phosphate synthase [Mucilaginibacter gossypii]
MIDKLHYISQQPENGSHLSAIAQALEAGCKWVQLRVKHQPADVILKYAIGANKLCNQYNAKLIVNDHPEIALKAGAYGVHLGLQDMSVAQARQIVGNRMIIGGTANTFEHVQQRVAEGVNYIGCGPYRFTTTKENLSPILGLEGLKTIARQMRAANMTVPLIAIGGVLPEDITQLMDAGLYGVAVSGGITRAADQKAVVDYSYCCLHAPSINELI